jgi:hypothetical protein
MTTISDELTVPLFRAHHREAHDCEHEAAWWKASPISSWRSRSARGDAGGRENGRSSRMAAGVQYCGQQVPGWWCGSTIPIGSFTSASLERTDSMT